jgi:hypothetical protein
MMISIKGIRFVSPTRPRLPEKKFQHEGNQTQHGGVTEYSCEHWFKHSIGKSEVSARPLLDSAPLQAPFFLAGSGRNYGIQGQIGADHGFRLYSLRKIQVTFPERLNGHCRDG